MSDIILFDYFRSSASYRVRIALALKEVVYQSVPTSLLTGENKAADYVARNPQGFVPMLSIDGEDLTQSLAIIDYLDAKFPHAPLLPAHPLARAKVIADAMIIIADIHPLDNLRVLKYLKNELDQEQADVDDWYRHWVLEGLKALEARAPETGFFGGDKPNLVDVCLVPQMYNGRRFNTPMDGFAKLVRIEAACNAIEAFANAHPDIVNPDA